jgi:hypothetical protein
VCIGLGVVNFGGFTVNFSKLTLVPNSCDGAVLIARPYGLLGREQAAVRSVAEPEEPLRRRQRHRLLASSLLVVVVLPAADRRPLALYAACSASTC